MGLSSSVSLQCRGWKYCLMPAGVHSKDDSSGSPLAFSACVARGHISLPNNSQCNTASSLQVLLPVPVTNEGAHPLSRDYGKHCLSSLPLTGSPGMNGLLANCMFTASPALWTGHGAHHNITGSAVGQPSMATGRLSMYRASAPRHRRRSRGCARGRPCGPGAARRSRCGCRALPGR